MTLKPIVKIEIFRAPQFDPDLPNEWRFCDPTDRSFSWPIVNPSGVGYVDAAYTGMGAQHAITSAEAKGTKRTTLINCALYAARQIFPKYGETVTDKTEVIFR